VLVGFMAGLMYLGQSQRLKHKRAPLARLRLPSLEWLQRANSHAIITSLLMLGVGILSGMVLNLINIGNEAAKIAWNDPVVLSTWLMFLWLLAAVVAIAVYRPARQGRKVAYLTVASFIFLIIMLAAGLLMDSRHWGRGNEKAEGGGRRAEGASAIDNWSPIIGKCGQQRSVTNGNIAILTYPNTTIAFPPSALRPPPSVFRLSRGGRPC